eukprot:GEMP01058700.1.p1 GENE.GEMP01058700.1~~GEMP01058700.1.p1  ORF type:complete len:303 (+),score=61.90 GEMP01058700.1:25-909(+)
MDLAELLERAQECQDQIPPDFESAMELYTKALGIEPNDVSVLESFGEFFCHQGCVEEARELLLKAVSLCPDRSAGKYFYLGQMAEGREALQYFEQGLAIEDDDPNNKASRVSAFCSVAELFMTDLCDEEDAQANVEKALAAACQLDGSSVEALASSAMYRKVIGELDVAKEHCRNAVGELSRMQPDDQPSSEIRLSLCKTMIDLALVEDVLPLLQHLLDEDEEDVQAWYLLCCAHLGSQEVDADIDAVEECFQQAVEICKKCPEKQECWGDILQTFHDGPLTKLRSGEPVDMED